MKMIHELREQDIDWETIHETVGSADVDRKAYYGFLMGLEEDTQPNLVKHAKTLQNIRKAKKMLGIERSINNEEIRDIALHQTFTKQVLDAIDSKYEDFHIDKIVNKSKGNVRAYVIAMGDLHFQGDKDTLYVLKRATEEIIGVIEENNIEHLYIIEGGDTIEGASLRVSQLMAIKSGMVNQVLEVADAYIKMLTTLSKHVAITFISVDSSNHTQLRNLGTKQNQLVEEDLMLVFNRIIELALPNLDFIHDKEVFVDICGYECFIAHSHEVKGSAIKYLKDVVMHRDRLIDFAFFFHRHHQETIDINSVNDDFNKYDKKLFYAPALTTQLSQYELQHNMSSLAGVGYYVFEEGKGHIQSRKLVVE